MSLSILLPALCEMLHAETGVNVVLGRPQESASTLFVWPWRLENTPCLRNPPATETRHARTTAPEYGASIHFLVLASSTLSADGLAHLEQARQALFEQPIINAGGRQARVVTSELSAEQLTTVFIAADIPLTLCLSAAIQDAV
jgi:hypothetical protein